MKHNKGCVPIHSLEFRQQTTNKTLKTIEPFNFPFFSCRCQRSPFTIATVLRLRKLVSRLVSSLLPLIYVLKEKNELFLFSDWIYFFLWITRLKVFIQVGCIWQHDSAHAVKTFLLEYILFAYPLLNIEFSLTTHCCRCYWVI